MDDGPSSVLSETMHRSRFFFSQRESARARSGMRRAGVVTLFASIAALAILGVRLLSPPGPVGASSDSVLLGPVRVAGSREEDVWIVLRDGLIDSVSKRRPPERHERSLGAEMFVTPGFADAHVHYPPSALPGHTDLFNLLFLAHGITSVRDMGSPGLALDTVNRQISVGDRPGPRIFSCRHILDGAGTSLPFAIEISDRTSLSEAIGRVAEQGADCIKTYRNFPIARLDDARLMAQELGLRLVGHLPADAAWSESRIDEIQHLCDPRCEQLARSDARALVEASSRYGVAHTPTLVAYASPAVVDSDLARSLLPRIWTKLLWSQDVLRQFGLGSLRDEARANRLTGITTALTRSILASRGTVLVGSDTPHPGVIPGLSLHSELRLLHAAGMSPRQALLAATRDTPNILGIDSLGQLTAGAPADLLLFREDPSVNLDALDSIEIVIAAGRVYPISTLRSLIEEQISYLNGPVYAHLIEPLLKLVLSDRWK